MRRVASKAKGDGIERKRALIAERLSALEPGLAILESGLRVGRTTIDLVALDAKQTLVLIALAAVADPKLLLPTLDAYIWCLQYPDRLQKLYPSAAIADGRPPRVMFIAERVPEDFVAWVEELSMVHAECVEVGQLPSNAAEAFPASAHASAPAPDVVMSEVEEAGELVVMNDHAMVDDVVAAVLATETQDVTASAGGRENGHVASVGTNGTHGANGAHGTAAVRHLFARAARSDAPAAAEPTAKAPRETPAAEPKAVRSAKPGASKQWQDFLDELAAKA